MARRPAWPCAVLLIAGALALFVGGVALYGRHAVLDQDAFAIRATGALEQDEVVDEVAARIAAREVEANPALAAREPVLQAAIGDVVAGARFPREFHTGVLALHAALFDGGGPATEFPLPGAARELRAAVAARSPAVA